MDINEEIEDIDYQSDTEYDTEYSMIDKYSLPNIEEIENFKKQYKTEFKKNITPPHLTSYEKTRVLCERVTQIENGAIPYIPNVERFTTAYSIAVEELNERKIPFIIRRPLPHLRGYEYIKLVDMNY